MHYWLPVPAMPFCCFDHSLDGRQPRAPFRLLISSSGIEWIERFWKESFLASTVRTGYQQDLLHLLLQILCRWANDSSKVHDHPAAGHCSSSKVELTPTVVLHPDPGTSSHCSLSKIDCWPRICTLSTSATLLTNRRINEKLSSQLSQWSSFHCLLSQLEFRDNQNNVQNFHSFIRVWLSQKKQIIRKRSSFKRATNNHIHYVHTNNNIVITHKHVHLHLLMKVNTTNIWFYYKYS